MLALKPTNDHKFIRSLPSLEKEIGEKPARLLLQLDYWIRISTTEEHEGKCWTYQSTSDIQKNGFPGWSASTINRVINKLIELELIEIGNFNTAKYDFTRWFALNPVGIQRLESIELDQIETGSNQNDLGSTQNDMRSNQNDTRSNQNGATIPVISTENSALNSALNTTPTPAHDGVGVFDSSADSGDDLIDQAESLQALPMQAENEGTDDLMESADSQPSPHSPHLVPPPLPQPRHRWGNFFTYCSDRELEAIEKQYGASVVDQWIAGVPSIPGVRTQAGYVIVALRKGLPPPVIVSPMRDEQDGKRYITGKYAHFIEH